MADRDDVDQFLIDFDKRQRLRMVKIYSKMTDPFTGEDIVQEAYYRALRSSHLAPDVQEEFDLWLWRIMRNCFFDKVNEERRKGVVEFEDWMDDNPGASQEYYVDLKKIEDFLMKEKNQQKKDILYDIIFKGYTPLEASILHDKGHNAVKVMIFRFMIKLREFYQVEK